MGQITTIRADFKDLDMSFKVHPLYADIIPVVELDAIRNAIRILLLTEPGEKPFNPDFGAGLKSYLFEPFDEIIAEIISERIKRAFKLFEPRVDISEVIVVERIDRNALEVTIIGTIVNQEAEVEITTLLERVR